MNTKTKSLQVLVATMYQLDSSIYKRMNLSSDAIIINQFDSMDYKKFNYNGNEVSLYTFNERGLSVSRNNALLRATADIICISDDDMVYTDTYKSDIISEFDKHPEADVIVFFVKKINTERKAKEIDKFEKVNRFEYRYYSSVNLAIRREKLIYNNIWFNTAFGSGSIFKCGEDTIFIKTMMDRGLKIYKSPICIGEVDMSQSTWFKGYDENFFKDKGAVIAAVYPKFYKLVILAQSIRNSKNKLGSFKHFPRLYRWYSKGAKDYMLKR